jgi:hypothetical protein
MKELLKALSDVKKEIGKISKDSTNPFFNSKYFDINKLIDHVEPVLEKHGLILLQPILNNKVYSTIIHIETAKTYDSCIELPQLNDPQKMGSAITYYRRYTLQSLLALQAEDDDGNKASGKVTKKQCPDNQIEKALEAIANGSVTKQDALKKLSNTFNLTVEQTNKLK